MGSMTTSFLLGSLGIAGAEAYRREHVLCHRPYTQRARRVHWPDGTRKPRPPQRLRAVKHFPESSTPGSRCGPTCLIHEKRWAELGL